MENFTPEQKATYERLVRDGITADTAFGVASRKKVVETQVAQKGILETLFQDVTRTPIRVGQNLAVPARLISGQSWQEATAPRRSEFLDEDVAPIGVSGNFGQDVRESVGLGLEAASYLPVARAGQVIAQGARGATNILRTGANLAREGAIGAGLFAGGQQAIEGEFDPLEIGFNVGLGGATGFGLGVAGSGVARAGSSLLDRIGSVAKGDLVSRTTDAAVEGAVRAVDAVRQIPEAVADVARGSVDRRLVQLATNTEKANEKIIDLYKKAIVPGVKKKKKTIENIERIDESITRAIPELAKKYDVENATTADFARIISQEKKDIFAEIDKGLVQAGEQGKRINTQPIVDELDKLLNSERASLSVELKNAIQKAKNNLTDSTPDGSLSIPKDITPSGAQDVIADLNAQLQSYFRGSTSGTNADVVVDTLVLGKMKKLVDDAVEDLGSGSFAQLKRKYADLKAMEDDVVHRAVFEAQRGRGVSDSIIDSLAAGNVTAGLIEPLFLLKGVAEYTTKGVLKALNDKDELVRQMFLVGKNINN